MYMELFSVFTCNPDASEKFLKAVNINLVDIKSSLQYIN